MDTQRQAPSARSILEVKTSRTGVETPEATVQFLSSLLNMRLRKLLLFRTGIPISLEMGIVEQRIHFYVTVPSRYQSFVESQLVAQYPKALITKIKDYLPDVFEPAQSLAVGQLKLSAGFLYPLKTYSSFKEVDPLSSLLGVLSKSQPGDKVSIQFLILPISSSWQHKGMKAVMDKPKDSTGATVSNPHTKEISEKISIHGFKTAIRIAVNGETHTRALQYLSEIVSAFSSFNNPSGNSLLFKKPILWQKDRLITVMKSRSKRFMPEGQILNISELATMFHFPGEKLATIQNISWHKTILSDPPENLPIAEGLGDDEKSHINFFARTEFKNKMTTFGIKTVDRRRHFYVIGKSGSGKSTFIANMAINDMRNKKGFCVIDPHGDLSEHILNYVPSYRVNDVIYMDPSDTERSFAINPLEVMNEGQKELVASGIVAIFKKLYGNSWGPRLEYILRNTILTVIDIPDATLLMVPELLTNQEFRHGIIERLQDPILKGFWVNEYETMTERLRVESISSVLNKVGQFTSSQRIRNIIGHSKSTIDIEKVMNEGKILILNLSQGYLGEDNATLLGAMIITKIQLAAMNRVSIAESERKDFYLYVDEFQNFATESFIKILSEARKFRLNLILANQYIEQIDEKVRSAIFGNAGTLMSFLIGAEDSRYMAREFGERFKEEDLLALGNYQAILKLAIDNITQAPFLCYTLPLPQSVTQNREKVLKVSRERYTTEIKK